MRKTCSRRKFLASIAWIYYATSLAAFNPRVYQFGGFGCRWPRNPIPGSSLHSIHESFGEGEVDTAKKRPQLCIASLVSFMHATRLLSLLVAHSPTRCFCSVNKLFIETATMNKLLTVHRDFNGGLSFTKKIEQSAERFIIRVAVKLSKLDHKIHLF